MSRVVAIGGSPRRGGNSELMLAAASDAARAVGAQVTTAFLNELDYRGCQACLGCREAERCILGDDATPLLDELELADALILATPIYFDDISGQTKLFCDRFYAFVDGRCRSRLAAGKRALILLCWEDEDTRRYEPVAERYAGVLRFVGFGEVAWLTAAAARQAGVVSTRPELLERCAEAGRRLVGG